MTVQLNCPHCRQTLAINRPVSPGSKIQCPACQKLFVLGGRTALGSSTVINAVRPAAPPPLPVARAYADAAPARPAPSGRFRDADDEPAPPPGQGNAALVGILLGVLGLILVVGVVLVLFCFVNPADEPTKQDAVAQLPPQQPTPAGAQTPPAGQGAGQNEGPVQVEVPEPTGVNPPAVKVPPVKVKGPPPKLTPAVQQQIDDAIDRGALFLRSVQLPNGTWKGNGNHPVGYTALPALTLLECGVPKNHISIQAAARAVRIGSAKLNKTYELALAILFLDKLGDPKDRKLIQALAMRLVAGQNYAGGWSYDCPVMITQTHNELLTFLQKERKYKLDHLIGQGELANPLRLSEADLGRKPLGPDAGDTRKPLQGDNPLDTIVQGPDKGTQTPLPGTPKKDGAGEGGLISGLPGAKDKPGEKMLPGDPPANKNGPGATARDRKDAPGAPAGKDKADAGKGKGTPKAAKPPTVPASVRPLPIFNPTGGLRFKKLDTLGDHSNTQFALLGLWVARRYDIPLERTFALAELRFRRLQNEDGGWGYVGQNKQMSTTPTMTCVGLLGLAIGRGIEYELLHLDQTLQGAAVKKLARQDEGIQKGLKELGKHIGEPQGRTSNLGMQNLYFLWSVERDAVLYNLKSIGDKDWYLWGAEILLANQQANGCWTGGGYWQSHPIIDTCFALLFLKRANLAPDLSDNLRLYIPVVDPDRRASSDGN